MTSFALESSSRLTAAVEELATLDPSRLGDTDLAALITDLSRAESRVKALRLKVVAAADRSRTGQRSGATSTASWAAGLTHADPRASQRDVVLATQLGQLPTTSDALTQGLISPEHASVIAAAAARLPARLDPGERDVVEKHLVTQAEQMCPERLRKVARRSLEAVEPDPTLVDADEEAQVRDDEAAAREQVRLTLHDNSDGTVSGHFVLPVLHGHLLRKILEAMTAPRRGRLGASQAQVGDTQGLRTDWAHARGLAFVELIEHLPTDHLHPRTAATLVVSIDLDSLTDRLKVAGLDTGESISAQEARRLACNAGIIPAVLGGASQSLDLGRLRRLFSESQRTALGLRHQSCAADGCERPFAWCELHHRVPWSRGGPTDLDHAVPLCHFHHQRIHDSGFHPQFLPDGSVRFSRRT